MGVFCCEPLCDTCTHKADKTRAKAPVVLHPLRGVNPALDTQGAAEKLRALGVEFLPLPDDEDLHEETFEQAQLVLDAFTVCALNLTPLRLVDFCDSEALLAHAGAPVIGNFPTQPNLGLLLLGASGAEAVNNYAATATFCRYANRRTWVLYYDELGPQDTGPTPGAINLGQAKQLLAEQGKLFGKNLTGKGATYHLTAGPRELEQMLWDMGSGRRTVTCQVQEHVTFENEKRFMVVAGQIVTYSPRLLAAYPGAHTQNLTAQQVRDAFYTPFDRGEGTLEDLIEDPDLQERMLAFAKQVAGEFTAETGHGFFALDCGEIVNQQTGQRRLAVVEINSFNQAGLYACDTQAIVEAWFKNLESAPRLTVTDLLAGSNPVAPAQEKEE